MQITGKSMFSSTTKKSTKGKFPTHCYEIGITDINIEDYNNELDKEFLSDYIDKHLKTVEYTDNETGEVVEVQILKIANSKYQFPMFDMNAERLEKSVPLSNGTNIRLELAKRYSEEFKTDYIVVKAVQVLDEIIDYNPFKRSDD